MTFCQIHLQGFQAHQDLLLPLDPGVTTIFGPSDIGKSFILRAIRWVTTNRPAGEEFIHRGLETASVQIVVDGKVVERRRGKGGNLYLLDGQPFKAFGNEVPSEILGLLNITEVNFQQQHDAPFWFSNTAGEVSRQLNRIVNLEVIDSTLSHLAALLRTQQATANVVRIRREDAREKRRSLRFAKEMNLELEAVEEKERAWSDKARAGSELENIHKQVVAYQHESILLAQAHSRGILVVQLGSTYHKRAEEKKSLEGLIQSISHLASIAQRTIPNLNPLHQLRAVWRTAEIQRQNLGGLLHTITKLETETCQARTQHKKAAREFKQKMGTLCPLCGQEIPS